MSDSTKEISVENVEKTTPHNKALYEAGKSLLIDSINTGREFCKFMITISTSAIPIHLGLLKFVLPEKYTLNFQSRNNSNNSIHFIFNCFNCIYNWILSSNK